MENGLSSEVRSSNISENGNKLSLLWGYEKNHESVFHAKWLRFRCQCNECHPGLVPGCWKNRIREFPDDLRISECKIEGNEINLIFDGEIVDSHVTTYDLKWLQSQCYCNKCLDKKLFNSDVITRHNKDLNKKERTIPEIDWLEYYDGNDQWTFQWMQHIVERGICFVRNTPSGQELRKLGELLGDLMITIFVGDPKSPDAVFDHLTNKNKGETKLNSAVLTTSMGMHQDFVYHPIMHNQIALHKCQSFDECIEGGGSILVDGFEAAEVLRAESPEHFKALSEIPVIFQYTDEQSKTWCLQKTNIVVDYYGKITAVYWNGDFSPELQVRGEDVDRYYRAYKAFMDIIDNRPEMKYRFKHTPGTMFCFNNVRMLHTREGFTPNGGLRHLIGLSVNGVNMKANYIGLAKRLGIETAYPKMGNGSSF